MIRDPGIFKQNFLPFQRISDISKILKILHNQRHWWRFVLSVYCCTDCTDLAAVLSADDIYHSFMCVFFFLIWA